MNTSQSPIRCYDKLSAGGLAMRTLHVLHEYASEPQGSDAPLARRGSAIFRQNVMKNAG